MITEATTKARKNELAETAGASWLPIEDRQVAVHFPAIGIDPDVLDTLLVQELEDVNEMLREAKRLHVLDLLLETLLVELHCKKVTFGFAVFFPGISRANVAWGRLDSDQFAVGPGDILG
jgi:hypothetical protein